MSVFGGLILTNRGRNLQAKVQAGTPLNYTGIKLGDGALGTSNIADLTALKNTVLSLPISKLKVLSGGRATIGFILKNNELTSGFYFRELGVFAQDPDLGEILYCYGNAANLAEYIPAGGGADIVEKTVDLEILTGNASSVSAVIDNSLIFETPAGAQAKADTAEANAKNASTPIELFNDFQDEVSSHLADGVSHVHYGVATGTANTYAVTLSPTPTAYVEGMAVSVKINVNATAASTLNVNGLGAKTIKKSNGTDVTNLKANGIYTFRYDGTSFILQGEGATGNATASDLLSGKTATTDAGEITGSMPNRGTFNLDFGQSVPEGYYSGGSVPSGKKFATGKASILAAETLTINNLGFTPSIVYFYTEDADGSQYLNGYIVNQSKRQQWYAIQNRRTTGVLISGVRTQSSQNVRNDYTTDSNPTSSYIDIVTNGFLVYNTGTNTATFTWEALGL